MSDQSPYQRLGISEDSSFDEVQDAKERLLVQYSDDRKQQELIESAYDSILMERLRMVQQGKIKVPDRIRYAEKIAKASATPTVVPPVQSPNWLQRFIDTPSRSDLIWPAGIYTTLAAIGLLVSPTNPAILQVTLALGLGVCLYFLNRKERKFGRALLLTLGGLILGVLLGSVLSPLIPTTIMMGDATATTVTMVIFWLISSFLR